MKTIFKFLIVACAMLTSIAGHADDKGRLYIIGEATPYSWSLDMAQSLLSTAENPSVYCGTIYLKAGDGKTFKFMEAHEWGSTEYGIPADAESDVVAGDFTIASGTLDSGYKQMQVAEDGNYYIKIDTQNLKADIVKSGYQETEIKYIALFLVGSATEGSWSVEDGTPLYQSEQSPYEYKATVTLKAKDGDNTASFKIANAIKGACSFDAQYFFFKDANDSGKISTDSTDDRQWSVAEDGQYTITVNTLDNTISIDKYNDPTTGIVDIVFGDSDATPTLYYNLQGVRVDAPANGVFIEVSGNNSRKVAIK